jgi:Peptidase family M1 domain
MTPTPEIAMRGLRIASVLALLLPSQQATAAEAPAWLPRYDLSIDLDIDGHEAHVVQRVTWFNRHSRPATELVFNVHSHYQPPEGSVDYLFLSKMLEIMRVPASQGLYPGAACDIHKVTLLERDGKPVSRADLPFTFRDDMPTALVVSLPEAVPKNQSITVAVEFVFHLPQRQGRWGQWKGVTFLTNWLPVVSVYNESGWHPTPFVAWHQPFYNEAGVYTARIALPTGYVVGCTGSISHRELQQSERGEIQELRIGPVVARDFALLASQRYEVWTKQFGSVTVRCVAFPEHEHYATEILEIAGRAIEQYSQWFGPFPYPEMTFVESYFGWNGNECAGLVMIDERVLGMPHMMGGYLEYLVSHETCHQWFYNAIGTDGYRETFMDEAFANYFAHRLVDKARGKNNIFLRYPKDLAWLPNIRREDYRFSTFYNTLGRGDLMPPNQEMTLYRHVGNLFAAAYDRGGKVVGMIEDRLGEAAFFDFMHRIYERYYFRILLLEDFQRELIAYMGEGSAPMWNEFFQHWLRGAGMTDWSVESVRVERVGRPVASAPENAEATEFIKQIQGNANGGAHRAVVILNQRAEHDEPTYLGFSYDGETFPFRIPIDPRAGPMQVEEPPATIEPLSEHRVRVEIVLPGKPEQIAVDPDQILPDAEPDNNYWKPRLRYRFSPIFTFLDENNLTLAYDRWNLIHGPWLYGPSYPDPWFVRANVLGYRVGAYRTDEFYGGVYAGYRTDFRDVAAGFDAYWKNVFPRIDFGINGEKSLFRVGSGASELDRAVIFSRYVITPASSLYTPPINHLEAFASWQRNFLPDPRQPTAGTQRFDTLSDLGIHYHADYLTPYWDPEFGFRFDATYAAGFPILGEDEPAHRLTGQLSWVISPPTDLGWLSSAKLAMRVYGAYGSPSNGLLFSLGGNMLYRGFDMAERQGSRVWIGSVELRLPVVRESEFDVVDHVVGLRNLYVAPFCDVGDVYVGGHSVGGVAYALGAGLRADVAWFSFIERTTLRLDVAKTINAATPFQVWIGIQHPF